MRSIAGGPRIGVGKRKNRAGDGTLRNSLRERPTGRSALYAR